MGSIPKASALYVFRPEQNYTCGKCIMLKDLPKGGVGCAWFGPQFKVSEKSGSCGYFGHGDREKVNVPWLNIFTPQELGYAENGPGFTCGRCGSWKGPKDCLLVDKDSPGDTPGEIAAMACCSLWGRDEKRGGMSMEQIMKTLQVKPAGLGAMATQKAVK